jgi:hypothetical protein
MENQKAANHAQNEKDEIDNVQSQSTPAFVNRHEAVQHDMSALSSNPSMDQTGMTGFGYVQGEFNPMLANNMMAGNWNYQNMMGWLSLPPS